MLNMLRGCFFLVLIAFLGSMSSCTKSADSPDEVIEPTQRTEDQLIKDSIYYYYKLYSLWEESIPQFTDISKFTDTIKTTNDVLTRLKLWTPTFAPYVMTGGTYDRFSVLNTSNGGFGLSSKLKMDNNDGYGLFFQWGAVTNDKAYPLVYFVEGGSPANTKGLVRSDVVLSINDVDTEIAVTCTDAECRPVDEQRFNVLVSLLRNSVLQSSMKIKVQKSNNEIKTYDLGFQRYQINPLILDTVFENSNIGYFAYSSFEEIENNNSNQRNIDRVFRDFATKKVKNLIVDLRYNGGGYVDAAVYLADKIINNAGKNKLMLTYELNNYLSRNKNSPTSSFKDVYFLKNNDLELQTVCFIVSNSTASASEMLINVLKPYMNVKIIASGTATFGKPVGFFEQRIMNRVGLWVTSFKLLNARNEGDYWTGINADRTNINDFIFVDFGKEQERMIAEALNVIGANGNVSLRAKAATLSNQSKSMNTMSVINAVEQKGALKL